MGKLPLRARLATSIGGAAGRMSRLAGRGDGSVIGGVIGLRVEPALEQLDAYLDQALLSSRKEVRVVHGHGSGRLCGGLPEDCVGQPLHPLVFDFSIAEGSILELIQ